MSTQANVKKKWNPQIRSPSTRNLPSYQTNDSMLKRQVLGEASIPFKKGLENIGGLEKMPLDFGTCWKCWIRITGQGLNEWRKEPFSAIGRHPDICPICGYDRWSGRIWYPKRFLVSKEIGNPSRRDNM